MPPRLRIAILTIAVAGWGVRTDGDQIEFVRDVRPILQQHCDSCHGSETQKSGLRLDIKSEAFKGGELYGASIIAGKPADSPLIQFISDENADLQMPPDGERLSVAEITTLTRWVHEGAVWPDGVDTATLDDRRDHWSFHPVNNPNIPAVGDVSWPRNPIDHFILARLEAAEMSPAPEADRVSWLRRVSFDLTGLPPTPEQAQDFLSDSRGDAYVHVVDDLLRSPRYGERWAQHWLDVVRYADTHGFEVNTERPHAWPYRDYVIAAFNNDTPYDQFIREQLVGDALKQDAATGFLVTASVLLPGQIGKDAPSIRLARQDALDEIVVNIGQTFLGLSVGCARCHDHKFDPIAQRDYYAMQAFVAGIEYDDRQLHTPAADARRQRERELREQLGDVETQLAQLVVPASSGTQRPPVNPRMNVDRFTPVETQRLRFTIKATNNLEPCLDELEVVTTAGENIALAGSGASVTSSGDNVSPNRHELRFLNDGKYGNSRSWMSNEMGGGWVIVEFPEAATIDRVIWGRDRQGKFSDRLAIDYRVDIADADGGWQTVSDGSDRAPFSPDNDGPIPFSTEGLTPEDAATAERLTEQKERLVRELTEAEKGQLVFAGKFRQPDEIHLLRRGDPEQPLEPVAPTVLPLLGDVALSTDTGEQERRRALADWITQPDNPLTARVMVNRIWQGHFGIGLVETPNDLGRNGVKPSHPLLLDWLAAEFIRSGWSVKHMHRLIVLSATYRQSAQQDIATRASDADGRLLSRFPTRRLEGEAIRDAILFVSGQLDLTMGGPGYNLFDKRGGLSGFTPVESFTGDGLRRMIYAHKVRRERDAVFGAFDCPDNGQSTPRRRESTTPIQALNLFNSRFVIEQADAFAARIETDAGDDVGAQVRRAYQLALNREPNAMELADAESVVSEHGLSALCRVLFNCNEFLFMP